MRVLRSDGKLKVDAGIVTGAQPIAISAGTQSASTGTILFSNSNSMSFGMSNSSIITGAFDAVFKMGVSTGGNTTGDTRVSIGQFVFEGGNNVTLSQITAAGNSNTVVIAASSGGASVDASWNFDTSTVAADPGNKKFRLNNATLASVTAIYVNDTTNQGFDIGQIAAFLASGMRIYIQQKNDATRAALFQITGAATDNTGWWTIPVSVVSSGTIYQNNADCAFVFVLSAAGASANITAFATSNTTQSSTGILSTNSMIFAGAGGVSVGISNGSVVISGGAGGGAPFGISAGTQSVSTGTMVFSDSNGISFGMSGSSRITASYTRNVASNAIQSVGSATGSGTNTSRFAADDHVHAGVFSMGVSTGGNTAGDTRVDVGRFVLQGGNNVTLSQITAINALNTIVFSAAAGGGTPFGISAGTQSVSTGTMVFSDSNGISFGMSGSSRITATYTVPVVSNAIQSVGSATGSGTNVSRFAADDHVHAGVFSMGASTAGNTIGDTRVGAGQFVIQGGPNITVSQITAAGALNTIVLSGGAAAAGNTGSLSAGTTRGTLGEIVFANGGGVSFGMNGQTMTASIATSLTAINISAGTTSNNLSALVFANSNNVSFGLNGSTVTATITVPPETPFGISAGTQSASTGTMVFSNSNNFTFGMSGSSRITVSYTAPVVSNALQSVGSATGSGTNTSRFAADDHVHAGVFSMGVSNDAGNTAGNTRVDVGRFILRGSNNITLSQITAVNALNTIVISGPIVTQPVVSNAIQSVGSATGSGTNTSRFAADDHVHAGVFSMGVSTGGNTLNQTRVDVGRFVFEGGNNVTLSQVTAAGALNTIVISAAGGGNLTAFATSNTTQSSTGVLSTNSMIFAGAGIASVGISNGSVVISVPAGGGAGMSVGISTQGNTAGTTGFVSNQMQFVGSGAVSLSQSVNGQSATLTIVGPASSSMSGTGGISISTNGSTISIGYNAHSRSIYAPFDEAEMVAGQLGAGSMYVMPLNFPNIVFDRVIHRINFTATTNVTGTGTVTMGVGFYTRLNANTLSLLHSTTGTQTFAWSGTGGNYSLYAGPKNLTMPWTTTITEGGYWIGIMSSSATAGGNASLSNFLMSQMASSHSGIFGVASASTQQVILGQGLWTGVGSTFPATIAFSHIRGNSSAFNRPPLHWYLSQTTT